MRTDRRGKCSKAQSGNYSPELSLGGGGLSKSVLQFEVIHRVEFIRMRGSTSEPADTCDDSHMAKRKTCLKSGCDFLPDSAWYCRAHAEELRLKRRRQDDAVDALHRGVIDGKSVSPGPLREEFERLRKWWSEVCSAVNSERPHRVLLDETEFATSWSIVIAQEIIDAEREIRSGTGGDTQIRQHARREVWERFANLEKGLMSNGVARPKPPTRTATPLRKISGRLDD